jgi:maltose O-acetyltransferase
MVQFETLGHLNIVVDDIERATAFYALAFGAAPLQEFAHFRNVGFARAAGFLEHPEELDVTIRFLGLPTPEGLVLELMQYHHPLPRPCGFEKVAHSIGCVGHISLRVTNVDEAFRHVQKIPGVRMIHASPEYRPFRIDPIEPAQFRFFDEVSERDEDKKREVCNIVSSIRYFYFVDPFGIQWEFEQGHTDIGSQHS